MKKINIKLPKMSNLTYFVIFLIVLVLPLSFVAISSYFIPSLNLIAVKTYYIYYGGLSLSLTSIFMLLMTDFFLKRNFKTSKKEIDNNYLLRVNLIFLIFHILITIISNILNYYQVAKYFIFALYFFYPLIYFCIILFLEPKKLTRKNVITILLSIYLLWYLLVPLVSYLMGNSSIRSLTSLKSLLYLLFYNYLRFTLLVMPFMSLALNKVANESKVKSIVHKFNFSTKKLAIIAIILVFIAISVLLLLSRA